MPRGGRRAGRPNKSYANRTDLNQTRALPKTTVPGQSYGAQTAQREAQDAVPMASGDLTAGPDHAQALQAAQDFQPPNVVPLGAPSMNPGQHVMTPPTGPSPQGNDPLLSGVALMNALGANASPEVKALRNVLSAQQANEAAP